MLLEYDIEIKPTKLIKGQGLENMMTTSNCYSLQLNFLANHLNQLDTEVQVMPNFSISPWYSDILYATTKLTGSCRVKQNKGKVNKAKICQVLYSE